MIPDFWAFVNVGLYYLKEGGRVHVHVFLCEQQMCIRDSRLTDREITVVGNPRVYKALRDQMKLIYQELQRLAVDEEVSPDLLETLQMVALTLNGLKEECE